MSSIPTATANTTCGNAPLLIERMGPGVGLVDGYKLQRNDPWHRICIGKVYNRFARLLCGVRIRDIDCDLRLTRREPLDEIRLTSTSGAICVELVRKIELTGCGVSVSTGARSCSRRAQRLSALRIPAANRRPALERARAKRSSAATAPTPSSSACATRGSRSQKRRSLPRR